MLPGYLDQFFVEQHLQIGRGYLNADVFFGLVQIFGSRFQVQFGERNVVGYLHTGEQGYARTQVEAGVLCVDTLVRIVGLQASSEVERVRGTTVQVGQTAPFGGVQFHFAFVACGFLLFDGQVMSNGIVDAASQVPCLLGLCAIGQQHADAQCCQ